jgi:Tfp pilus assembly PilM family ATPase
MFTDEDKALLSELNMQDLPEDQQAQQLKKFYETLHVKVSMALEDFLSDEQFQQFEKVSVQGDGAIATWFREAVPNYDQFVAEQAEILKSDIKQMAARIKTAIDEADEQ